MPTLETQGGTRSPCATSRPDQAGADEQWNARTPPRSAPVSTSSSTTTSPGRRCGAGSCWRFYPPLIALLALLGALAARLLPALEAGLRAAVAGQRLDDLHRDGGRRDRRQRDLDQRQPGTHRLRRFDRDRHPDRAVAVPVPLAALRGRSVAHRAAVAALGLLGADGRVVVRADQQRDLRGRAARRGAVDLPTVCWPGWTRCRRC